MIGTDFYIKILNIKSTEKKTIKFSYKPNLRPNIKESVSIRDLENWDVCWQASNPRLWQVYTISLTHIFYNACLFYNALNFKKLTWNIAESKESDNARIIKIWDNIYVIN